MFPNTSVQMNQTTSGTVVLLIPKNKRTGLTYLHLKCIFNEQIQMNGLCFTLRDYTSVSTLYFSLIDLKGYSFIEVALQKQLFKIQMNHFQSRVQQIN